MPAPSVYTYSADAKVAAQTSFRDLIDSGAGAGTLKLRTSADVLLGTITLTDPCGTVNGTTGQLSITQAADGTGVAAGTVAYGELSNSTGTVYLSLPVEAGTTPVSGKLVINTLTVANGSPLTLVSCTIG